MKIAFHINTLTKGGAERAVTNLAQAFTEFGHEVTIITSFKNKSEYQVPKQVRRINLSDTYSKSFFYRIIVLAFFLRRTCNKEKFDVIIPFISGSILRALFACCFSSTKIIGSVRNDPAYEYAGLLGKFMSHFLMNHLDGCVFQTSDACRYFPKKLQSKAVVIFNSIKDDFFMASRSPIRNRILNCGRLCPQKNQLMLIRAFSKAHQKNPSLELHIFGKGELYNVLNDEIEILNLKSCVFLEGETSNVKKEYEQCDLFVLSSNFEGMPNALMEAMAVGAPCISTDCPCGGPRSLIENNVNGILVPVNDELRMCDAIIKLVSDSKLLSTLGNNASNSVRNLTGASIVKMWLDYVSKISNK